MTRTLLLASLLLVVPAGAAAETWLAGEMTDAGPRPRGLVTPETLDEIRDRVAREPYTGLLARIEELAARPVDLDDHEIGPERSKAETARACAWLHLVDRGIGDDGSVAPLDPADREDLGARAVELLLSMRRESRSGDPGTWILDIHTAQELHLWADTLDLLLGAEPGPLGDDRAEAIQAVADLAADLYADFEIDNWYVMRGLVNNHRSKSAAAIGLAAIALNGEEPQVPAGLDDGRYDLAAWADFAVRYVDFVQRDVLTDPDGGNMEGGAYQAYSALEHDPFAWSWSRYTGAASWTIQPKEELPPYYVTGAWEPYTIPDLWTAPWLQRRLRWTALVVQPDCTMPPVDDSDPGVRLQWGRYADPAFEHAGLYRWLWEQGGMGTSGSVDGAALLVATFDDSVAPTTPEQAGLPPSVVLPRAGHVVLRSGWGPEAVYALFLAEHGNAAAWSQTRWGEYVDGATGHEHPDALSFLLHAGGEALLIDSGYLGWEEHDDVNDADNHSLVLVDGGGAPGARLIVPLVEADDGELVLLDPSQEGGWSTRLDDEGWPEGQGWVVASDLETTSVAAVDLVTRFQGQGPITDHARRVTFLADRFFVLHDRLVSRQEATAEHVYTHLLHTHCGGDLEDAPLEELEAGFLCTRPGARLRGLVLSPDGEPERAVAEDWHDEWRRQRRTHAVVRTSMTASTGTPARFLTLLAPEPAGDGGYPVTGVEVEDCDGACVAWSEGELACAAWSGVERAVTAPDGGQLLVAREAAFCEGPDLLAGSFAGLPGDDDGLLVAAFDLEGGAVTGWQASRLAGDPEAALALPAVADMEPDGACGWELEEGSWRIEAPVPGRLATAGTAREVVAGLRLAELEARQPAIVLTGEQRTLDASDSCAAGGVEVDWSLESKPELSEVTLDGGDGAWLPLQVDLPGLYVVRATVTGPGGSDEAVLELEALGERVPLPEVPPEPEPEIEGCGCRAAPRAGPLTALLVLLALAVGRRRRTVAACGLLEALVRPPAGPASSGPRGDAGG